jgi:hypothetical protein
MTQTKSVQLLISGTGDSGLSPEINLKVITKYCRWFVWDSITDDDTDFGSPLINTMLLEPLLLKLGNGPLTLTGTPRW